MARSSSYRMRWANLYRSGQGRLRTAAGASLDGRIVPEKIVGEGAARTLRDQPRNTAEKSRRVCRHNGLFVAIATVGENRDGIGLAVGRSRTSTRGVARGGAGHTKWREMPMAFRAGPHPARPRPGKPGRGFARASSLRRMTRCTLIATAPALRCAPRRGRLGDA